MADETTSHPNLLSIELLRTGEGSAENQAHVDACVGCSEALGELAALAREIRGLGGDAPKVPAEIDQRIRWNTRKRSAQIRRGGFGRVASFPRPAWAVAAMVFLAVGLVTLSREGFLHTPSPSLQIAQADIDGNGSVDMLDALRLANGLKAGTPRDPAWDVNGDGYVDERDAQAVAQRAVSIEGV